MDLVLESFNTAHLKESLKADFQRADDLSRLRCLSDVTSCVWGPLLISCEFMDFRQTDKLPRDSQLSFLLNTEPDWQHICEYYSH